MRYQAYRDKPFDNRTFNIEPDTTLIFRGCEFINCKFKGVGSTSVVNFTECEISDTELLNLYYEYYDSIFSDCFSTKTTFTESSEYL